MQIVVVENSYRPQIAAKGDLDNRMEAIFDSAGQAILELCRQWVNNYATEGVPLELAAAAVGKALVVNGVSAMASAMGVWDVHDVTTLCDEINGIIAVRLEELAMGAE
jgi:hypothetical protein